MTSSFPAPDNEPSESQLIVNEAVNQLSTSKTLDTDWSTTLCAAPGAIVILGECMVLSSVPSATSVRMDYGELGASLPSKLFECNQIGRRTFVEAHSRMLKISMYASNVAPIIDKIVMLLERPEGKMTRRMLDIQIGLLKKCADTCTKETEEIFRYFKSWKEFTVDLAQAIAGKKDEIVIQKKGKRTGIIQSKAQADSAQDEVNKAARVLSMQQEKLNDAIHLRERALSGAEQGVQFGAAAALETPLVGMAAISIAATGVYAAQFAVASARQTHEARIQAVEAAERDRRQLVADLYELQHEESSLEKITSVLLRGIERLVALQGNVEQLLLYFSAIHDQVENLVEIHNDPLVDALDFGKTLSAAEKDEFVQEMILRNAFDIKVHFTMMQKISQVYTEVSERHIITGFKTVDRLALLETSLSDEDVSRKHHELDEYRRTATDGIEMVTEKRKRELVADLQSIVEKSAKGTVQRRLGIQAAPS